MLDMSTENCYQRLYGSIDICSNMTVNNQHNHESNYFDQTNLWSIRSPMTSVVISVIETF